MNEHLLVVTESLVPFVGVFFGRVEEETSTNCLANLVVVFLPHFAATDYRQPEAVQNRDELVADILSALQRSCLYEVIIAPLDVATMLPPDFVDREHSQMVSI